MPPSGPLILLRRHRRLMDSATAGAAAVGSSVYTGGNWVTPLVDEGAYNLYDVSCHLVTLDKLHLRPAA